MVFLSAKTSVTNFIRDFNSPYEKTLLRVSKSASRDVYCFTRKGVHRFLLTKKVRALPRFAAWIRNVLLELMRPEHEKLRSIQALPPEARIRQEGEQTSAHAPLSDADHKQRLKASLIAIPSAPALASWAKSCAAWIGGLTKVEAEREAKKAAVEAATPAARGHASTAGKNWQANERFSDKTSRVDQKKYQADIPEILTRRQQ